MMNRSTLYLSTALIIGTALPSHAQFDGFVLYNNQNQSTSYLIDEDGQIAHTWSLPSNANYAMALKPDGNIVRGAVNQGNVLNGAAVGGKVQEFTPSGELVWEFVYSSSSYVTHHDLCLMPNGHVLLTAWAVQTNAALQALGYTGTQAKWPTRIIEVEQNGTGGQIVWEWNMLDRFIQYVDPNKPNYMPIADHPERMNINVVTSGGGGGPGGGGDWFHVNGIDYNAELDQIAFSSRFLSEIFIIDHSTTTAEAAGHTGGNSGMGGDFLYRWGKPANYGTPGTQTIAGAVHDVRWIKAGRPNAGYLQFVNNVGGPGNSTTIDAVDPEREGYLYPRVAGMAYGPASNDWRHSCLANSAGQSASDRMPDGNTFVALSDAYMYEVDDQGTVVWQYNASPQKAFRYTCDDPGIIALLGENPCGLTTGIAANDSHGAVQLYPNPANGIVTLGGLARKEVESVVLMDATGREVMDAGQSMQLDVSDLAPGIHIVRVRLLTGELFVERLVVEH